MAYPYRFYFCWVNEEDNAFVQDFGVNQEVLLEFSYSEKEGDFPRLEIRIKNPMTALLAPGRKRWAWFSFDTGPATPKQPIFFGQVVAVPDDLDGNTLTYQLLARPRNVNTLKTAVADTLRVLPWWDKAMIDRKRWADDDLVLETRPVSWHYHPTTHAVSTTGFLIGEGGVVEYLASEHVDDRCKVRLGTPPIHTVRQRMEFSWTQQGTGILDLSEYIAENWPNNLVAVGDRVITSFTLNESNWPQSGASLKDGWTAATSEAVPVYDLTTRSRSTAEKLQFIWPPDELTVDVNNSRQYVDVIPPGSYSLGQIYTDYNYKVTFDKDPGDAKSEITSISISTAWTDLFMPLYHTKITLIAGWEASRPYTESVEFIVTADMQPIITMPDDTQITELDDLKSNNLSEPLDPDNYEGAPIGDSRRRSYVTQDRGRESLQFGALRARNAIIMNSRAVRVTFSPIDLEKMMSTTLRHNALVHNFRIPGDGTALGKVIEKTIEFNGVALINTIVMASCLGRGGTVTEVDGEPEYVDDEYIDKTEDYQQYIGEQLFVSDEADLLYSPPLFDPQDDGLDLISGFDVEFAIDQPLTVTNSPAEQRNTLNAEVEWIAKNVSIGGAGIGTPSGLLGNDQRIDVVSELATTAVNDEAPTSFSFALKTMKGAFQTDYVIETSTLKLPKMIDLES